MFPEWPRLICKYISDAINKQLIEKISDLTDQNRKSYVKDFEAPKEVMPDLILVSSRHLFRCPYSLHEKTGLASVVLDKDNIEDFKPSDADPLKIKVLPFVPEARKNEAKKLLIQALDWDKERQKKKDQKKYTRKYKEISIDRKKLIFPPCVQKILKGIKDGKKRSLFALTNYFRYLNFSEDEIREKIEEWNKKNKPRLKEGYIRSQFSYAFKRKKILPPNCDKHFKDINVCDPDGLCQKIKNPLNYTLLSSKRFNHKKSQ